MLCRGYTIKGFVYHDFETRRARRTYTFYARHRTTVVLCHQCIATLDDGGPTCSLLPELPTSILICSYSRSSSRAFHPAGETAPQIFSLPRLVKQSLHPSRSLPPSEAFSIATAYLKHARARRWTFQGEQVTRTNT